MRKIGIFIGVVLILSLIILVSANSQEDMTVVDNSVFDNPQRCSAIFNHDEHNETAGIEECNECHHLYEDGKLVEDESSEDYACGDCHESKADENKPALMKAYHMNCKDCHDESEAGPIMCGECHKR